MDAFNLAETHTPDRRISSSLYTGFNKLECLRSGLYLHAISHLFLQYDGHRDIRGRRGSRLSLVRCVWICSTQGSGKKCPICRDDQHNDCSDGGTTAPYISFV